MLSLLFSCFSTIIQTTVEHLYNKACFKGFKGFCRGLLEIKVLASKVNHLCLYGALMFSEGIHFLGRHRWNRPCRAPVCPFCWGPVVTRGRVCGRRVGKCSSRASLSLSMSIYLSIYLSSSHSVSLSLSPFLPFSLSPPLSFSPFLPDSPRS